MSTSLTRSLANIGGVSSILQSVAYVVAVVAALFIPLERITDNTAEFAVAYSADPIPITVLALALITLGVLGITAVVPATGALLDETRNGWVTFGKNIALLSLAVIVTYYTWFLSTISSFVAAYNSADASSKAIVSVNDPHAPINWVSWFLFGGMGLWVAVVGVVVFLKGALARGFVAACVIKSVGFWMALTGIVLHDIRLAIAGTIIGALVGGTLYHAWLGVALLKKARSLR